MADNGRRVAKRADGVDPYSPVPGSVPPALVGRDADLRYMEQCINRTAAGQAANPPVFFGERGMGKTVLLRRGEHMARERGAVVLRAELSEGRVLADIFERTLLRATEELGGAGGKLLRAARAVRIPIETGGLELSAGVDWRKEEHGLIDSLDRLNRAARKHGRFLAITIDELQSGNPPELRDFASYLLETWEPNDPILLIAAGLPETQAFIKNTVKTYTERWQYRAVRLLSAEDTREALERPALAHGFRYVPEALDRIVEASSGYPHLVQQLGSEAWNAREGNVVTLASAQIAIPLAREHMAAIYTGRLNELSPRECAFAVALADLGAGPHAIGAVTERMGTKSERISSIRDGLQNKDIIRSPRHGTVEFRLPGMDAYVREHRAEFVQRSSPRFSPFLGR